MLVAVCMATTAFFNLPQLLSWKSSGRAGARRRFLIVSFLAWVCLLPPMPSGEEKSLTGEEVGGDKEEKLAALPSISPSDLGASIE